MGEIGVGSSPKKHSSFPIKETGKVGILSFLFVCVSNIGMMLGAAVVICDHEAKSRRMKSQFLKMDL